MEKEERKCRNTCEQVLFVWVIALLLPPLFASVENTTATSLNEHFPFLPSDVAPSSDLIPAAVCCRVWLDGALAFFSPFFFFAPKKRRQTRQNALPQ